MREENRGREEKRREFTFVFEDEVNHFNCFLVLSDEGAIDLCSGEVGGLPHAPDPLCHSLSSIGFHFPIYYP